MRFCLLMSGLLIGLLALDGCKSAEPNLLKSETLDNSIKNDQLSGSKITCDQITGLAPRVLTHRYRRIDIAVPLNWKEPESTQTNVAFHIFDPITPSSVPLNPIIEFTGGPGFNSYASISNALSDGRFNTDGSGRQMIFFDQRGTGGCSDPFFLKLNMDVAEARAHATLYATESIVRDVEAFRKQQGIGRWIIYGSSHGSLLVHRYLEMLDDLNFSPDTHPIAQIYANVDPATESWNVRRALGALHSWRRAPNASIEDMLQSIQADTCRHGICGPQLKALYDSILASIQSTDCAAGRCGEKLREYLVELHTTNWFMESELLELKAAYGTSVDIGRQKFISILTETEVSMPETYCDLSKLRSGSPSLEETNLITGLCFNVGVNSFDTVDDSEVNDSSAFCSVLEKLDFLADVERLIQDKCKPETKTRSLKTPAIQPRRPILIEELKSNLNRYHIPLTLGMGYIDDISPPETYKLELESYGLPADEIINACYDPSSPLTREWKKDLVQAFLFCDGGHGSFVPVND